MEDKVKQIEESIKAAQDAANEVKGSIENQKVEMDKKFENVDESIKDLKKMMEEKKEMKEVTFLESFKNTISSEEFKSNMAALKEKKIAGFNSEVKLETSALTGDVNRTQQNYNVYGPSFGALSFLNRLPRYTIGADRNRIVYVNASFTDNTDYVGEGQAIASGNSAAAVEKYREVAKVSNKLEFTSETMSDMSYFLNWARNQSRNAIFAKVDSLIWSGDGADGTKPNHIYGIKGAATAFDAEKAGLATAIDNADSRALLLAMKAQIEKETNGAYTPNVVFMSAEDLVKFINLRDANGNQLSFPDFQAALGCQIISSPKLATGEILMVDINAIQLHEKLGFELEVERVASTDKFVMYLRWRGNVVIPDESAKAVVYVAKIDTAISAITKA